MDLTHAPLPAWLLAAAWVALVAVVLAALRGGGLRAVLAAAAGHLYPATLVILLVLWQMRAVTPLGPGLHVLGATLLVLMFGWRAALAGLCLVLAGHTANGGGDWAAFGVNGLTMVAVPVLVSHLVLRVVERRLPAQPFGYILLAGFAGAGLAMAAALLSSSAVLLGLASLDADHLLAEYTFSGILLLFPEAFLTGTTVAWLAMFYPASLSTWTPPWERTGGGSSPG